MCPLSLKSTTYVKSKRMLQPVVTQEKKHDFLDDETRSWFDFSSIMRSEDRKLFQQMMKECYKYRDSIASKGELFSTESMLMSLIFIQQKMITSLIENIQGKSLSSDKLNDLQTN